MHGEKKGVMQDADQDLDTLDDFDLPYFCGMYLWRTLGTEERDDVHVN